MELGIVPPPPVLKPKKKGIAQRFAEKVNQEAFDNSMATNVAQTFERVSTDLADIYDDSYLDSLPKEFSFVQKQDDSPYEAWNPFG